MNTLPRPESSLVNPRHFRTGFGLLAATLIFLVYAANRQPDLASATPTDALLAARLYAARHADGGVYEASWCDPGTVRLTPEGRYRVEGCVVGVWRGRRFPRRFTAVVENRAVAFVDHLPIAEFRFLD